MLGVDERRDPALSLRIRDHVQGERRLTARFGTIDLRDPSPRNSAHSNGGIEVDGPGWNRVDPDSVLRAESHDRALAAGFLDLRDRQVQRLLLVVRNSRHSHFVIHPFG